MASANPEQLKAIEHSGGVLLKAGAGSGKTFVLQQHMVYLTNEWIREFKELDSPFDFSQFIKSKFSKVVLMTFTKKAAGEISIRLTKVFNEKVDTSDEDQKMYWIHATEQLDYLTVTTIHGFCFKLIRQGFFPEVDLDDDMISDAEYSKKIEDIFEAWIETEILNQSQMEFIDLLLKDKEHVLSAIKSIFSDPTLRKMWNEISSKSISENTNKTITDLMTILGLELKEEDHLDCIQYSDFDGKPWFEFVKSFQANYKKIESLESLLLINSFFSSLDYKIPRSPSGKAIDDQIKRYYNFIKDLNAFLKKNGTDFVEYSEHIEDHIPTWFSKIYNLIQYVETEYEKSSGITFSDLEYIVRMGLENQDCAKAIAESYHYLIVDEFQDTSFVQFEIIQKILGNDYSKLFCVGDIKQAIYGFRGGELGVFLQCEDLIPKVLSLKNNYRSDKKIIHFNNNFFEFLFAKGLKFEGEDIRPVQVDYQEVPLADRPEGEVYQIKSSADFIKNFGLDSVSNNEVEYLEALSLIEEIKRLKTISSDSVCILYKKLKPSLLLIGLMIEEKISFTAQIKVPYGEDPILGVFKLLLEYEFDTSQSKDDYLNLVLKSYLALFDNSLSIDTVELVQKYLSDQKYFGLYQAFYKFLSGIGLSNSNYTNNLSHIKTLIKLGREDKELILNILGAESAQAYSLDFQFGQSPDDVIVMTAHASKGLEFSHVLLGGIYTNDKSFPFTSLFGKVPMSFKWAKTITSKNKFKTPEYFLEAEMIKHKDFSESKRLFYVACTRAEKTLGWVNLDFGKIKNRKQSNSWRNGTQVWENWISSTNPELYKQVEEASVEISIEKLFSLRFLKNASNKRPLFHIDSMGLTKKDDLSHELILPELSVTRLATISNCPRKFYLQNICKLNQNDIDLFSGNKIDFDSEVVDEEILSSRSFSSSAERGTKIHSYFESILKNDFEFPKEISDKDAQTISWAVDKLKNYRDNFLFISEKMIKFELYQYMISGIPDLIILSKDQSKTTELWDFKTGKRKEEGEIPYVFQLMTYAYALYQLDEVKKDSPIKLVLCYVDDQNLVEKEVHYEDVDNYLSDYWAQVSTPEVINKEHCSQCIYNQICQENN